MNYDDYRKQEKPKGKRSILFPYREGIFSLKADGFSHLQIRDWLLTENIVITAESIRNFITNQKAQEKTATGSVPLAYFDNPPSTPTTPTPTITPTPTTKQPDIPPTKSSTGGTFKQKADKVSGPYFEDPNVKAIGNFGKTQIKENT